MYSNYFSLQDVMPFKSQISQFCNYFYYISGPNIILLFMNVSLIQEFFIFNKMFNVLIYAMHILFDLFFSYLLSSVSGYDF